MNDQQFELLVKWMIGQMDGREVEIWHGRIRLGLERRQNARPNSPAGHLGAALHQWQRIATGPIDDPLWPYHVKGVKP